MNLTESGVIEYLLYRGLITYDDALSHQTIVSKSFSRNRNFIVNTASQKNYFVKQATSGNAEKIKTLRTEANFYWLVNNDDLFSALRPFICRYFDYHPSYNILIIEGIKNKTDLYELIRFNNVIDNDIAQMAGKAMAALHSVKYSNIKDTKANGLFLKMLPWAFKVEVNRSNNDNFRTNASRQLFEIVNKHSSYVDYINKAKEAWQINCLIHGDIKLPNLAIDITDTTKAVKLIDLEICDFGDPCWDVAGFFQSFLLWWVDVANTNSEALDKCQPAIRHFWKSYFNESNSTDAEDHVLIKSMQYTAVRIIQSTYEYAVSQNDLHVNQVKLLQLSLNILKNAKKACADLLGIE